VSPSKRGFKFLGLALAALPFTICSPAQAQQPKKIARIGYVSGAGSVADQGPYVDALRQGLKDLGYAEGKNFVIEYRGAEGKTDRMSSLVTELVELKVDLLVLPTTETIRTAKQATKTIPVVMVTPGDPVATGLIDSLARPGGNITGVSTLSRELIGKRLELLYEVVPRLARLGIMLNMDAAGTANSFRDYEIAARSLKIRLQSLNVRGQEPDIEGAFRAAVKGRVGALITVTSGPLFLKQKRIVELAIENRLPSLYQGSSWVESGGLLSYSASDLDAYRRTAVYVDKILKGAKPADLPVEQPTKFELVINLKTAKQIGLAIPPNVLARADRVIR
jgi:ABC-type uncharacterized transport system substrate-binding protein